MTPQKPNCTRRWTTFSQTSSITPTRHCLLFFLWCLLLATISVVQCEESSSSLCVGYNDPAVVTRLITDSKDDVSWSVILDFQVFHKSEHDEEENRSTRDQARKLLRLKTKAKGSFRATSARGETKEQEEGEEESPTLILYLAMQGSDYVRHRHGAHNKTAVELVLFNVDTEESTVISGGDDDESSRQKDDNDDDDDESLSEMCGMTPFDKFGANYILSYRPMIRHLGHLVISRFEEGSLSENFTFADISDNPVLYMNGSLARYVSAHESSFVFYNTPCPLMVTDESGNEGRLLVHSKEGTIVLMLYRSMNDISNSKKTVLLPKVLGAAPQQFDVNFLKLDRRTGDTYVIIKLFRPSQIAFETLHNLQHNTVVKFTDEHNSAVRILFRVDANGIIRGIKQISKPAHVIDIFHMTGIDLFYERHSTSLCITGHVGTLSVFMRYDNVDRMALESRRDPDLYVTYPGILSSAALYSKSDSIVVMDNDDGLAFIGGETDHPLEIMEYGKAYLLLIDVRTGEAIESRIWPVFGNNGERVKQIRVTKDGDMFFSSVYDLSDDDSPKSAINSLKCSGGLLVDKILLIIMGAVGLASGFVLLLTLALSLGRYFYLKRKSVVETGCDPERLRLVN